MPLNCNIYLTRFFATLILILICFSSVFLSFEKPFRTQVFHNWQTLTRHMHWSKDETNTYSYEHEISEKTTLKCINTLAVCLTSLQVSMRCTYRTAYKLNDLMAQKMYQCIKSDFSSFLFAAQIETIKFLHFKVINKNKFNDKVFENICAYTSDSIWPFACIW